MNRKGRCNLRALFVQDQQRLRIRSCTYCTSLTAFRRLPGIAPSSPAGSWSKPLRGSRHSGVEVVLPRQSVRGVPERHCPAQCMRWTSRTWEGTHFRRGLWRWLGANAGRFDANGGQWNLVFSRGGPPFGGAPRGHRPYASICPWRARSLGSTGSIRSSTLRS